MRYHAFMRKLYAAALFLLLLVPAAPRANAQAYNARPKLVVLLVIDQFRGDYLDRYRDSFTSANGFNLFLKKGAYFNDCYYDYANTQTAPGHATIGTGAYTDGHGIESNDFWDASRSNEHKVSSVEDERYQLVDLPASSLPVNRPAATGDAASYAIGASPRNLRASPLG